MDTTEIQTIIARAKAGHPCARCGQVCFMHALCPACRPTDLCDYCDNQAIPGDPEHWCAACKTTSEAEHEPAPREAIQYDQDNAPGCWQDAEAERVGITSWGPL